MRFRRSSSVLVGAGLMVSVVAGVPGASPAGAATNLVSNPGLEKLSGKTPTCWTRFRTGSPAGSIKVLGARGKRYVNVTQGAGASGELAIVQSPKCAVKAKPGQRFTLSMSYQATKRNASIVLFRRDARQGWVRWENYAALKATKTTRKVKVSSPFVPEGTSAIRWAVTLNGAGTLLTDAYGTYRTSARVSCTEATTCRKGRWWTRPIPAAVRAVHVVMLHNGKVLMIAGSGNSAEAFARKSFTTMLYDPATDRFKRVPTPIDMFCAGHVQLPNGNVLVMGGTKEYGIYDAQGQQLRDFLGEKGSYIFNVKTERYQRTNDMSDGHWYPSATALGNGDVYSVGGLTDQPDANGAVPISRVAERFQYNKKTGAGRWLPQNQVQQSGFHWAMYPSLVLMQDGRLFYTGSSVFGRGVERATGADGVSGGGVYDDGNNKKRPRYTEILGLRAHTNRDQSASVLLPPAQAQKVLTLGGGNAGNNATAHRHADVIDLKKATPRYRPAKQEIPLGMVNLAGKMQRQTGAMGKMYVSAVLLPDGKVMETGGGLHQRADPVYEASIFDPKTERFKPVAADPQPRTYHSSAILLPDGRVLAIGNNPNYDAGQANYFDQDMTIFTPPYLARGPRPSLTLARPKTGWAYGSYQKFRSTQPITSASLIRPAAVTHSSDPNQRSVALPYKTAKGVTTVKLNANPNLTPPGWYMLFVTNKSGVPSVAKWIHVG